MEDTKVRLHAVLNGRVQGVGFRYFVRQQAEDLGLPGWVRNLRTGGVELVAEGERVVLEELVAALRHGPPGARVDDVNLDWTAATGEFHGFAVTATQ
jgi:acylphosphatase